MNNFKWVLLLSAILFLGACKSEYDQLVRKELGSGVQRDSLIFGMHLGENKKDFFANCWDLNKQQIISQGSGNQYARFVESKDSTVDKTPKKQMDFYGMFDENDIMRGMEMIFTYVAWAPWNEDMYADALLTELQKKFLEEYGGNDFITIPLKGLDQVTYVKVDGNMQILMFNKSEKEVLVRMEDLNYKLKDK